MFTYSLLIVVYFCSMKNNSLENINARAIKALAAEVINLKRQIDELTKKQNDIMTRKIPMYSIVINENGSYDICDTFWDNGVIIHDKFDIINSSKQFFRYKFVADQYVYIYTNNCLHIYEYRYGVIKSIHLIIKITNQIFELMNDIKYHYVINTNGKMKIDIIYTDLNNEFKNITIEVIEIVSSNDNNKVSNDKDDNNNTNKTIDSNNTNNAVDNI